MLSSGGWRDGYRDAVFRVAQSLKNVRGIIGPWSHEWPDIANPGECYLSYVYHYYFRT